MPPWRTTLQPSKCPRRENVHLGSVCPERPAGLSESQPRRGPHAASAPIKGPPVLPCADSGKPPSFVTWVLSSHVVPASRASRGRTRSCSPQPWCPPSLSHVTRGPCMPDKVLQVPGVCQPLSTCRSVLCDDRTRGKDWGHPDVLTALPELCRVTLGTAPGGTGSCLLEGRGSRCRQGGSQGPCH